MRRNTNSREDGWEDIATTLLADLPQLDTSADGKACLMMLAGGTVGEMVTIGDGITIGRSAEADLCIPDIGVSRLHARVERTPDGGVRILDQGSRNGTFVNSRRIHRALLVDGDRIHIGTRAILRFSYADSLDEDFQKQMYEAALRDSLTGLFNFRHLVVQLDTELQFVKRHGTPLAVVLFDIDHFKTVNDRHGHLVGSAALRSFAEQLRAGIRSEDFAARYGGDEFVVVCRGINGQSGVCLAERLQQGLRERLLVGDAPDLRITFSAGVAAAPHSTVQDAGDLLRLADEALYRAKEKGRDCVCLSE